MSYLRRSERLAGKPKVNYSESYKRSMNVEEDKKTDFETETMKEICCKKGWIFSNELVKNFDEWRKADSKYNTCNNNEKTMWILSYLAGINRKKNNIESKSKTVDNYVHKMTWSFTCKI